MSEREAQEVGAAIAERWKDCGLELHPGKTKVVRFCERLGVRFPGPTHLVALAKQMGTEVIGYIESRLEGKLQLEIRSI
jgi:hypothetical protein